LSPSGSIFLFVLIIVCHAVFAILWVYYLIGEIRSLVRQVFPRIYLGLFLCCNKETLQREIKVEEYNERTLGPVISKIDDLIDYLKDRRNAYEKGKLPFEDLRLRALIAEGVSIAKEAQLNQKYDKQGGLSSVLRKIVQQENNRNIKKLRPF
jgi:hypothetical protein